MTPRSPEKERRHVNVRPIPVKIFQGEKESRRRRPKKIKIRADTSLIWWGWEAKKILAEKNASSYDDDLFYNVMY